MFGPEVEAICRTVHRAALPPAALSLHPVLGGGHHRRAHPAPLVYDFPDDPATSALYDEVHARPRAAGCPSTAPVCAAAWSTLPAGRLVRLVDRRAFHRPDVDCGPCAPGPPAALCAGRQRDAPGAGHAAHRRTPSGRADRCASGPARDRSSAPPPAYCWWSSAVPNPMRTCLHVAASGHVLTRRHTATRYATAGPGRAVWRVFERCTTHQAGVPGAPAAPDHSDRLKIPLPLLLS